MAASVPPVEAPRTDAATAIAADDITADRRPSFWRRFLRHRGATIGLISMMLIVAMAVFGPGLSPYDPLQVSVTEQLQGPSRLHPFGTDQFGRDVATRMLYGATLSLQMGFFAVTIAVAVGIGVGLPTGYYGGRTDMVSMRFIDILMAFPSILLALSIVSILGPSLVNAMVAVSIAFIPMYVRLIRGSTMTMRDVPYVEAARVVGSRDITIMMRNILPNLLGPIVVVATLGVATAIIIGASLSFLGLGAQPPTPEWGAMLSDGRNFIRVAPWLSVFPGLAIMVTVLAINLIGDGLRDVLDPRMMV
jgi:peptide/nickel transport system permease protein